jgi:hypothetical protein
MASFTTPPADIFGRDRGGVSLVWLGVGEKTGVFNSNFRKSFKFPKLWLQNTIFYLLKKLILILTAFGVWNLSRN